MKTVAAILHGAILAACAIAAGCSGRSEIPPEPPVSPPETSPLFLAPPGSEGTALFKLVILELPRWVGDKERTELDIDKLLADRHARVVVRRSFSVGMGQRNALGSPEEASKLEKPGLSLTIKPEQIAAEEGKIEAALDIYFADDFGRGRRTQGRWSCTPGKYAVLSVVGNRQDFFDRRGKPAGWSERTEIVAVLFEAGVLRN